MLATLVAAALAAARAPLAAPLAPPLTGLRAPAAGLARPSRLSLLSSVRITLPTLPDHGSAGPRAHTTPDRGDKTGSRPQSGWPNSPHRRSKHPAPRSWAIKMAPPRQAQDPTRHGTSHPARARDPYPRLLAKAGTARHAHHQPTTSDGPPKTPTSGPIAARPTLRRNTIYQNFRRLARPISQFCHAWPGIGAAQPRPSPPGAAGTRAIPISRQAGPRPRGAPGRRPSKRSPGGGSEGGHNLPPPIRGCQAPSTATPPCRACPSTHRHRPGPCPCG